ncbi:MAG: hypothetical protein ACO390_17375, partial [bacterium]
MLASTLAQVTQQVLVNAHKASHSKVVGKNLWSILCKSRTILQTCRRSKSMRLRLLLFFFLFLLAPMWVGAQEESGTPTNNDPLLDPAAADSLQPGGYRFERNFALLFGIQYGVSPLLLTSPGIVLGAYYDPIVVGLELVDSDILSALDDLRKDGIGDVRITNTVVYGKVFIGDSFYLVGTSEQRRLDLYNRGYIRYGERVNVNGKIEPAQAYYDMTIETNAYTVGVGFQKFSENLFTSFDFLRWVIPSKQSYSVENGYNNKTSDPNFMARLKAEQMSRRDRWYSSMKLP